MHMEDALEPGSDTDGGGGAASSGSGNSTQHAQAAATIATRPPTTVVSAAAATAASASASSFAAATVTFGPSPPSPDYRTHGLMLMDLDDDDVLDLADNADVEGSLSPAFAAASAARALRPSSVPPLQLPRELGGAAANKPTAAAVAPLLPSTVALLPSQPFVSTTVAAPAACSFSFPTPSLLPPVAAAVAAPAATSPVGQQHGVKRASLQNAIFPAVRQN